MNRKTFLTISSLIALAVGTFALALPAVLLLGKGVAANEATNVWAREVGILMVSTGVTSFLVRGHADSPTLRAFLIGGLVLQIGIFPIELFAYARGTIPRVSAVLPNSILHLLLASGFGYFVATMRPLARRPGSLNQ